MLTGMSEGRYHDGNRRLQDAFDTRRLADRLAERAGAPEISDDARAFIESVDTLFLATADAEGRPTCSYKGGEPGFVCVLDERTVAFPSYDGNGMFLSLGNLLVHPEVGLLFIDLVSGRRLRLDGTATVSAEDPLLPDWPGAQLIVRVRARVVFGNCARYIHRYERVGTSPDVPDADGAAPVPEWKRMPQFAEVLPAGDPARG
jgi:predicted pyridoxine 5'-phosphate oxidase superfamily flavin-nucleotide-binding protein